MNRLKKNRHHNHRFVLQLSLFAIASLFFHLQTLYPQRVKIGWDLSADPDIHRYNIYRTTHIDSSFSLLANILHPDATYMDEKMSWDTHYYYVATSVDKYGMESGFSNMIDTTLSSQTPVQLYSFSGHVSNSKNIILEWSTTTESNNYGFEIQRRSDKKETKFESIDFIEGNGTVLKPKHYRYVDENVAEGTYHYRLKQVDFEGTYDYSDTIEITLVLPSSIHLHQNYPNPFNASTEISYNLPVSSHVELIIYDMIGHQVCRLIDQFQTKGKYSVKWNARDSLGKEVSSGIYYYKIKTESFSEFRKMMLVK